MITETDDIARAIDLAAETWPQLANDRTALLKRLILKGVEAIQLERAEQQMKRLDAISEASGLYVGIWPANWRDEMRNEWPE